MVRSLEPTRPTIAPAVTTPAEVTSEAAPAARPVDRVEVGGGAPSRPAPSRRRGAGVRSLVETFAAVHRAGVAGIDGLAYVREVLLPSIRSSVLAGRTPAVVFDLDNTLFDTRFRTLEAAHRFGREAGVQALAEATIDDVGLDGRDTAARLGLAAGDVADRFQAFWSQFFWAPESFALDQPIERTLAILREAKEAGAEIYYLTGRVDALRGATMREVSTLPDGDEAHVITKPRVGMDTPRFKAKAMRDGLGAPTPLEILAFVTEGRRDLRHIQQNTNIPTIWFDFPIDREGHALAKATPVVPW